MNKIKKISIISAVGGTFICKYIWLDQPNEVWAATRDTEAEQEITRKISIIRGISSLLISDSEFNRIPTTQTINEDAFLDFRAINNNQIRVQGSNIVSSALSVNNGVLTILTNTHLITQGMVGSNAFTLSGNEQQINDALATLSYQPDVDFNGMDRLTIVTTVTNGETDTDTVQIIVSPVDDGVPDAVDDNFITLLNTELTDSVIGNDTLLDEALVDVVSNATTLQGGSISINADGSFSYTPLNGFIGLDSFSYTLRDADDDTDTATINIVVGRPDIIIPDNNGAGLVGDESVAENSTLSNGMFTIIAPAGLATGSNIALSIQDEDNSDASGSGADLELTLAQLNALATTNQTIIAEHGNLILTGFNTITGIISYTFDPTSSFQDHSGGDLSLVDSFTITATDASAQSSAEQVLDILITDTGPVANDEIRSINEDTSVIAGNAVGISGAAFGDQQDTLIDPNANPVIDLDFGGTDGTVGTNLASEFGTMVIDSAGVYTYTLDNTNTNVQGLKGGESEIEVFTYTIQDGDGDTDTGAMTVTINGVEDATPTITIVDEDGGTTTADHSVLEASGNIINGTATINATAGIDQLSVDGQDISNASTSNVTLNGNEGILLINGFNASTGVISYRFLEDADADNHNAANDNVNDTFTIQVIDNEGDSASDTLDIQILDTTPTANNDANSIAEDSTSVSGNVTGGTGASANDVADTLTDSNASPVTGIAFNSATGTPGVPLTGDFGSLLMESSGSYTYTLDNNNIAVNELDDGVLLTDRFFYTLSDGDGDSDTAQLTITIDGSNDAPTLSTNDGDLSETGSALSITNTVLVSDPELNQTVNVVVSSVSESGTPSGLDNSTLLSFLTIPAGPILDNTETSDQFSYTFNTGSEDFVFLKGGESVVLTYTLTATDSRAASSTANIVITINGVENAPPTITIADSDGGTTPADNSVTEASSGVISGTATVTADAGIVQLTLDSNDITNASSNNVTLNGSEGTLVVSGFNAATGIISYNFTEDSNAENHNAANDNINDTFTINLIDREGDSASDVLDIRILDTAPTAAVDTNQITEDGLFVVTGDVTTNDTTGSDTAISVFGIDFDGPQTVGTPFSSDFGTLDLNSDGTYTYTLDNGNANVQDLNSGETLEEVFTYTITDTDGDTSFTSLVITINGMDE